MSPCVEVASFEDEDATYAFLELMKLRGWAMRRGHRKRLGVPKRGKAAILAEMQGQGEEVFRGRSFFKRTIACTNPRLNRARRCSPDLSTRNRRTQLQRIALKDAYEASEFLLHADISDSEEGAFDDEGDLSEEGVLSELGVLSEEGVLSDGDELTTEHLSELLCAEVSSDSESWVSLVKSSSIRSTAASLGDVRKDSLPNVEHGRTTPWDLAMARAFISAELYARRLRESGLQCASPPMSRSQKRANKVSSGHTSSFQTQLLRDFDTRLSWTDRDGMSLGKDDFNRFRRSFFLDYGAQLCERLQDCFRGPIIVRPTPLDPSVQQRHLDACNGGLVGTVRPAYHGTNSINLQGIYRNGLLIPGQNNNLKVVNGSAHGLGIYTASVNAPSLSFSYCRGEQSVLICSVLDDAAEVLHAGDAMVVFNASRVAPLFVASRFSPVALRRKDPPAPKLRKDNCDGPAERLAPKRATHIRRDIVAFLLRRGARKRRDSC